MTLFLAISELGFLVYWGFFKFFLDLYSPIEHFFKHLKYLFSLRLVFSFVSIVIYWVIF